MPVGHSNNCHKKPTIKCHFDAVACPSALCNATHTKTNPTYLKNLWKYCMNQKICFVLKSTHSRNFIIAGCILLELSSAVII